MLLIDYSNRYIASAANLIIILKLRYCTQRVTAHFLKGLFLNEDILKSGFHAYCRRFMLQTDFQEKINLK